MTTRPYDDTTIVTTVIVMTTLTMTMVMTQLMWDIVGHSYSIGINRYLRGNRIVYYSDERLPDFVF